MKPVSPPSTSTSATEAAEVWRTYAQLESVSSAVVPDVHCGPKIATWPSASAPAVGRREEAVRETDRPKPYAGLGPGTLERAHAAGLSDWDLIVVDEAHRTSGRIGKPWAVVHDSTRIPSLRRLYMTATRRLWQLDEDQEQPGAPGELVASMEDAPDGPFGSRCFTLTLSQAIGRGICAPYLVVCVFITNMQFQAAMLVGAEGRSDEMR